MHGVRSSYRIARASARGLRRANVLPVWCFHSNASREPPATLPTLSTKATSLCPLSCLTHALAPRFLARTQLGQARSVQACLLCAHLGFIIHFGVDVGDTPERLHC